MAAAGVRPRLKPLARYTTPGRLCLRTFSGPAATTAAVLEFRAGPVAPAFVVAMRFIWPLLCRNPAVQHRPVQTRPTLVPRERIRFDPRQSQREANSSSVRDSLPLLPTSIAGDGELAVSSQPGRQSLQSLTNICWVKPVAFESDTLRPQPPIPPVLSCCIGPCSPQ